MLEITAKVLENKNINLSNKNFGNKYDNSVRKVIFSEICENGNLLNKYAAFLSPSNEIFLFPLNSLDNSFIVSSNITKEAGAWKLIYLATNKEIIDGVIDYDYKVFVSNSINFTITENFLNDTIEEPTIDPNLNIYYEQLDETIIYLHSEDFINELLQNFELTEQNINQITTSLKSDETFKQEVKGDKGDKGDAFKYEDFTEEQLEELRGPIGDTGPAGKDGLSLYEYWLNDNVYKVNDRVDTTYKFYINKDLAEYFRINYSSGYQTLLFNLTSLNYILKVEDTVLTIDLYNGSSIIESYTEEQFLNEGVYFYNDNVILSISTINNYNPIYKQEYLKVEEYTKLYAYELTEEDLTLIEADLKADEEFKAEIKGEKGDNGEGIYTEWLELYRYQTLDYINPDNLFYWNKDVIKDIVSKGEYYNNRIVLQTDDITLTFNYPELVFNIYSTDDLTVRTDWINISDILSTIDAYITLANSSQLIRLEENLLLKTPWISIEDYSSIYLKGEKGEQGEAYVYTDENVQEIKDYCKSYIDSEILGGAS